MADTLEPDPSWIGGIPKTPFVRQLQPSALFATRANRFRFLAESSELAPYLTFLAGLSEVQAALARELPDPMPLAADRIAAALQAGLPPINRLSLVSDEGQGACLTAFCERALTVPMPGPARQALEAVRSADAPARGQMLASVLADVMPEDAIATHLFVACAVQLHLARLAATLIADALRPVATGSCPACGGRPVCSSVLGLPEIDNVRYANCAGCATQWNEVRIKCLCCGSTKGISFRSVESEDATVKAEVCAECGYWVKTLYQARNASLEPVADDVGSLGLDVLMLGTRFRRGGFNPFLAGY